MESSVEIQTQITEVNNAIKAVMLGQKYTIDTGQSKQSVERPDLGNLQKYKQSLQSDLSMTLLRENGCQITRGISC